MLSKAILLSNSTTAITFLLSITAKLLAPVVCISGVPVEWNFLFPLCVTDSLSLDSIKALD